MRAFVDMEIVVNNEQLLLQIGECQSELFYFSKYLHFFAFHFRMVTPPSRTMSDLLSTFDAVLEHYHENFASVAHQTEVAARLRQLRTTMFEHLPTIAGTFIQTMEPLPNLVRLNESQRDFICFGDLHGSLTDLVNLRHTYWRDGPQLAKFHFVFLGRYILR